MKDFWAEELQNQRKNKLKKLAVLISFILIIIVILILIAVYMYNIQFRKWCDDNVLRKEIMQENTKYIDLDGDNNTQTYAYDKYICLFRKKKLEFYNNNATKVGEIELDLNNAVFTSAGKYLAIAEKDGQKFYLICGKEKLFENEIEGNISQINVSSSGYVSIVISNTSYKSIVDVFSKTGKEIFKTNLVNSRVSDVCISEDSKYLAIAEVDLSGIIIKSSIQVVSIELARTDQGKAMLNKYEAPTNKLIMNIEYQQDGKLICMYNDTIEILDNQNSTEIINLENKQLAFMTVNLTDRIAILEEISTGEYTADTKVNIINPTNQKKKEYIANDVAKALTTYENKMAINFGTELHIINTNGILLKKYISESEINDIVMTDKIVGIVYRDRIHVVNI